MEGRGSRSASSIAADSASMSWPSTSCTCQSLRRKRAGMSSTEAMPIAPSSVIRLSSQRKQSLPSLSCPASEMTSCAEPLLQAAVADQRPGAMVHDARSEAALEEGFGDRHAGGVGDALAERAGRGLDAAARVVFGVAFAVRAQFAEALDLVDGDLRVAAEVEQRVEQHGAVAVRLHEAVAVEPERVLGVELQVPREQRRGDVGGAERRAGMPFPDSLDRVHGQEADRIGHQAGIDVRHGSVSLRLAPLPGVWGGVCRAASAGTRPEICARR